MKTYESILDTIGRTPLIKLHRISEGLPVDLYVKYEAMNPGGSIKDRIAVAMVREAERVGLLKPGDTIIEATAGNTGIGLAMIAAVRGYHMIFVIPDKMSADKINLLKAFGAEVIITPSAVPPDSPESYNGVADRLARELPRAFRPHQFTNPENPRAHYLTTGWEIWEDTSGAVDVIVAGMGTGGTISGVGRFLKERKPSIVVVGADPEGSILSGDTPHPYKVEGVGEDFIPRTFDRQVVDEMVRVSDAESFAMARRLAREEGILAGGSSGMALAAAIRFAHRLAAQTCMVVILPDTGRNYLSTFYDDQWMHRNGFDGAAYRCSVSVREIVAEKHGVPLLVSVSPDDTLATAARLLKEHQFSQLPVISGDTVVGSITEVGLLRALYREGAPTEMNVAVCQGMPLPSVEIAADIGELYRHLMSAAGGVVVYENQRPIAVVTREDLIRFLVRDAQGRHPCVSKR